MDQITHSVSSAGIHPAALLGFIEELRRADCNIGLKQYADAHDLILDLAAEGGGPERPAKLWSLLDPELSPNEQDDLKERFDVWAERLMNLAIDPTALLRFIDELRRADYNIGSEQYVTAQGLIFALAARGELPEQPARLRNLLGPVLCSTPNEQDDFKERFNAWAGEPTETDNEVPWTPGDEEPVDLFQPKPAPGSSYRKWWWVAALAVLILATALVVDPHKPDLEEGEDPPPPVPEKIEPDSPELPTTSIQNQRERTNWLAVALSTVLSALLAFLAIVWWRYRAHLFISRWAMFERPEIIRLSVKGLRGELFHGLSLSRTARDLRRRREIPSYELDIATTVEETVRGAGWFTPVYGVRQITPEYLLLVDRTSYRDQQAKLVEELLNQLRGYGVLITHYHFAADPRVCFPFDQAGSPLTLRELASKYPDHHLLIFSDAAGLFSSRTGELEAWAEQFARWKNRAVLTPEPPANWGFREWTLFRSFAVVPATPMGLASLIRRVGRSEPVIESDSDVPEPFPTTLRIRPLRWIDRHPPEGSLVEETLKSVERFLGERGLLWLRACAVYPTLDWNLTVYLGNVLQDAGGCKLLELHRLASLARLPWFRHGYMPDWLRLRLVRKLSPEQQDGIRSALNKLLLTAGHGAGGFSLHIARARSLFKTEPGSRPLKDYIFVSSMAWRLRELLVMLPRGVEEKLRELTTPRRQWVIQALVAVVMIILGVWSAYVIFPRDFIETVSEGTVETVAGEAVAPENESGVAPETESGVAPENESGVAPETESGVATIPENAVETVSEGAVGTVSEGGVETVSEGGVETVAGDAVETVAGDAVETVSEGAVGIVSEGGVETVSEGAVGTVAEGGVETVSEGVETVAEGAVGTVAEGGVETVSEGGVETVAEGAVGTVAEGAEGAVETVPESSARTVKPVPPPTPPQKHSDFSKGYRAYKIGDWEDAADLMRDAIASDPEEGKLMRASGRWFKPYLPRYYLGVALFRIGCYKTAADQFNKSIWLSKLPKRELKNLESLRREVDRLLGEGIEKRGTVDCSRWDI